MTAVRAVLAVWAAGCAAEPSGGDTGKDGGSPVHPTPGTDDPTDPSDPSDPSEPTTGPERRFDCSGMDPADPAPLGGRVFLTFDDGPHPDHTPVILDTLRAWDAPATFFVLGVELSDPAVWPLAEEIVADPLFDLASHGWSHTDLALVPLSEVAAEMDDTRALIETFGVSPVFFRFPYGDSTCETHDLATDRGYRVAGWHIDTADWCYAVGGGVCTPDDYWRVPEAYEADMLGFTLEQIRRFDGGVVLFHDIHGFTADQLPLLLERLTDEGFTLAALDDAAALPNLNAGTPADLPFLGERCDTRDDRCWQVEHGSWCEPVAPDDPASTDGICTLPCEGLCPDRDGAAVTFCADLGGAGQCAGRAASQNEQCAALPGTVQARFARFGDPPGEATVCAPPDWVP